MKQIIFRAGDIHGPESVIFLNDLNEAIAKIKKLIYKADRDCYREDCDYIGEDALNELEEELGL